MPASIFSETELARLASFPEEIPGARPPTPKESGKRRLACDFAPLLSEPHVGLAGRLGCPYR